MGATTVGRIQGLQRSCILLIIGFLICHSFASTTAMQPKAAPNSCGKGFSSSSSTFPPKCHSSSVQQEKRILTRADDYHHDAVARREELVEAEYTKTVRTLRKRLGSRPPMCRDKCETCFPCEAVKMVPTPMIASTTASQHNMAHLDYSNYDPVGWKCKCGARIFNP